MSIKVRLPFGVRVNLSLRRGMMALYWRQTVYGRQQWDSIMGSIAWAVCGDYETPFEWENW